jgi:glyoxylase-like metal-dependent hydrolase (beta-lactamase superfamily II)
VTRVRLDGHDVLGIRAANPGPFTLTGTNSWIVSRDPAWLVDPGPALPDHIEAVVAEIERRGGLGGIALTHDHRDHSEAVAAVRSRFDRAPLAAGRGAVDLTLTDGAQFGPLTALATPGHAPDHFAFLSVGVALTGDAVLGQGSVFIAPDPGALVDYLAGLRRLASLQPAVIGPGHGPAVSDPAAKLEEYIAHRLDRERRLLDAIDRGARSVDQMLDAAWSEVPAQLRPAATVTLAAHLDKLDGERRLPEGVQRPGF